MRKRLITLIIMSFIMGGFTGCSKEGSNDIIVTPPLTNTANKVKEEEKAPVKQTVEAAGWKMEVLNYKITTSLENIKKDLGIKKIDKDTVPTEAEAGYEYVLVKLNMEKVNSMEQIQWDKFYLIDDLGNSYTRIDDSFLSDLGVNRMTGMDLNFGAKQGWIMFEIKEGYNQLRLNYKFNKNQLNCIIFGEGTVEKTSNKLVPSEVDYLKDQKKIDDALIDEAKKGYTLDNPLIVLNPYGNSPLTAIAIFKTEEETSVKLTVKGKKPEDDITTTFDKEYTHILPIYGLYSGDTTNLVFQLDDGRKKTVKVKTDNIDANMDNAVVKILDSKYYNYSKLTFVTFESTDIKYGIAAYDSSGDIRYALKGHSDIFKRLNNGNIMVASSRLLKAPNHYTGLMEIDLCGKVYNDYIIPNGYVNDFVELKNGNLLAIGNSKDLQTLTDHIYEIDRVTGEIIYDLDLKALLEPMLGENADITKEDWFQCNSLWYDKKNDTILLSSGNLNSIIAVKKTDKTVEWIIGDSAKWENADSSLFFTPSGEEFEWAYGPHQVSMLYNGDILVFDNGVGRPALDEKGNPIVKGKDNVVLTGDQVYSRAVIYRINLKEMTIRQIWDYGKIRGQEWYSSFHGGAEFMDQRNYWLTSGGNLYDSKNETYDLTAENIAASEKTTYMTQVKNDEVIFELKLDQLVARSTRMPIYSRKKNFDPAIEGKYLNDLGVTTTIPFENLDTKAAISTNYKINVVENPDRTVVVGNWPFIAEDASLILRRSDGKLFAYSIPQLLIEKKGTDAVTFKMWFSPIGLEDYSYDIYILNNGVIYNSGYKIDF